MPERLSPQILISIFTSSSPGRRSTPPPSARPSTGCPQARTKRWRQAVRRCLPSLESTVRVLPESQLRQWCQHRIAMPEESQEEPDDRLRSANEVAQRCVVLYAVLAAGHGEPRDELVAWLRREELWEGVSPTESEFLLSDSPTKQQLYQGQWRAEALFPLLWSFGLIANMPIPQKICDVQLMQGVLPPLFGSVAEFISSARLRSDTEIHNANEEIYQIHWRVRDAKFRNEPTPQGQLPRMPVPDCEPPAESYDAGVVQERHYALNWLIGYCGQDWDDITTDT